MQEAAAQVLAVIYLRVSTEEQAKKGFSLPQQREACRAKAEALATEAFAGRPVRLVLHEVVDDFGGDVLERPALEEMRSFVRANRPAWFVCMDPDRFSRNLAAQLLITDEIERAGTRLAFVQHEYAKTAEGRLFYQLRGAVAEFEKAKILERTARGKRGKLKAGRRSNGVAPFGYRHNRETDELEVFESEARWVRQIFRWVIEEQQTFYQIAHTLHAIGVPTKKGGRWRGESVAYILRSTTYTGRMHCNRYDCAGQSAHRRLPREKREPMTHRIRPKAEWIPVAVPAIIDQATFDLAQQRLRALIRRGGVRDQHLLSMLPRCGTCGSPMSYVRAKGSRYLRCNRRYADRRFYADGARCQAPHQRADPIEAGVWETVCGWLTDPVLLEEHLREAEMGVAPFSDRLEHLSVAIAALEHQLAEEQESQLGLMRRLRKGLLTEAAADQLLAESTRHITHLEEQLAVNRRQYRALAEQLKAARPVPEDVPEVVPGTLPQGRSAVAAEQARVKDALARLTPVQQRQLVRQLVRSVLVDQAGAWRLELVQTVPSGAGGNPDLP